MNNTRRVLGAATLVASALLLSACMKMNVDLTLSSDDTATGEILMAVSDRAAEAAEMTPAELLKELGSEKMGEGAAKVTDYAKDGFTGKRYVFKSSALSEVSDETVQITRDGDEFVVDGSLPLTAKALGLAEADLSDPAVKPILDTFDVNITITFPGEVTQSNGQIDGNTVTWAAQIGEKNKISARGSAISPEEAAAAAAAAEASASPSASSSTSTELVAAPAGAPEQDAGFWGPFLSDTAVGAGIGLLVGLIFVVFRMARTRKAAAKHNAAVTAAPASEEAPDAAPAPTAPAGPPQA